MKAERLKRDLEFAHSEEDMIAQSNGRWVAKYKALRDWARSWNIADRLDRAGDHAAARELRDLLGQ